MRLAHYIDLDGALHKFLHEEIDAREGECHHGILDASLDHEVDVEKSLLEDAVCDYAHGYRHQQEGSVQNYGHTQNGLEEVGDEGAEQGEEIGEHEIGPLPP